MFHHFPADATVGMNCLVRSTDLTHASTPPADPSQPFYSYLLSASQSGYTRGGAATYKPAVSDLEKLARYFGVSLAAFFPESNTKSRTNALLSATAGLDDADLDEVRLYALFRKSRRLTRRAS